MSSCCKLGCHRAGHMVGFGTPVQSTMVFNHVRSIIAAHSQLYAAGASMFRPFRCAASCAAHRQKEVIATSQCAPQKFTPMSTPGALLMRAYLPVCVSAPVTPQVMPWTRMMETTSTCWTAAHLKDCTRSHVQGEAQQAAIRIALEFQPGTLVTRP